MPDSPPVAPRSGPTSDYLSRLAAIAVAVVVVISASIVGSKFAINTDLGVFMPVGRSSAERLLLEQLDRGATSNLVFVSLSGAPEAELGALNKNLAARFRESPLFHRAHNGEYALSATDQQLINDYRYLLTPTDLAQRFTEAGLHAALQDRLRGLTSPFAAIKKRFLRADPTGEQLALFDAWSGQHAKRRGPLQLYGVWFSQDRQRTLMVLEMGASGLDFDGQAQAVQSINDTFAEFAAAPIAIELTGPGVFAVETNDLIRADVRMLTILATLAVGAFLLLAFRSLPLTLYVFVPLLAGVIVAAAAVLLVFGSIHGVTLGFGVTLTGIAVDYPIHLFAHLDGDRSRVREHIRKIWPTLRLGAITTIIAYTTFVLSEFEGLKQLGVFAVAGLATAALTTRWFLPVVMPRRLPVGQGVQRVPGWVEALGRRAHSAQIPGLVAVALAVGYLVATERPRLDFNVDSLSPIQAERRAADKKLRKDLGFWAGGKLLVSVAPTAEHVLRHSEMLIDELDSLVERGAISGYDMAAQYLPSKARQQARQAMLPDRATLQTRLGAALNGLPFKPGIFGPFLDEVEQAKITPSLTLDNLSGSGLDSRLAPLLFESNNGWIAPVLLHGVADAQAVAGLEGVGNDVETVYLHLKGESTRVMSTAIERVAVLLGWGLAAIYLVLAGCFRSVLRPLRILGPTLASVITVAALLVIMGLPLTLFHLVSLLLVIGLGLDYALFFNRLVSRHEEWATTFKALWVCCVTTVLVFGMLVMSHTPPLQAIGVTVALGAALCFLFGAIWASSGAPPRASGSDSSRVVAASGPPA